MQENQQPIIIVGGGTGGHIVPLIALGEELTARKIPFIFVGSKNSREEAMVKDLHWNWRPISAGKWRRYFNFQAFGQNIVDLFRSIDGIFQSARILRQTKARLVFSKGGYVALPMIIAAWLTGRQIIIHESDAVMGATNRFSVRFASKILTAFDPKIYPHCDQRFIRVGIPIRKVLRQAVTLKAPAKTRPLLFFMGGIQGSSIINGYVKALLNELLPHYDIVHSTGEPDFAAFKKIHQQLPEGLQNSYKVNAFIDRELPYYFKSADLLICRASATTLAEAALFSKCVLLIPLPHAAGNHQVVNARQLEKADAAIVKEQYQLTPAILGQEIEKLMKNGDKRRQMGENLHTYFNSDASLDLIVTEITNHA